MHNVNHKLNSKAMLNTEHIQRHLRKKLRFKVWNVFPFSGVTSIYFDALIRNIYKPHTLFSCSVW